MKDIGIDLGTVNTLVYVKGKGIVNREPSVVAVDRRQHEVLAIGKEAREMIGRTPRSVAAVRPLKDGVIADFTLTAALLEEVIRRCRTGFGGVRPRVTICIPSGVTEVERRAVEEAAHSAGARRVRLMEEPMAAAIGAGLSVKEPTGRMVVDIGGGTSEVAVIALGDIVTKTSVRVAGDELDEAIAQYVKDTYHLLIGERTAEAIKITMGCAVPPREELTMTVKGRQVTDGLPHTVMLSSGEIGEALQKPVREIIGAIRATLERTPPELAADILENGIVLTGGGALLAGLDRLIREETGIEVTVADDPLDCVVKGTGRCLDRRGR